MTIKEFLDANMGKHVKIGFTKSFIFCGVVTPMTKFEILNIEREYIRTYERLIKTSENTLKGLKSGKGTKIKGDEKKRKTLIKRYTEHISSTKEKLEKIVPFLEVESDEIYESRNGEIIFTSKTNDFVMGNYWDEEEYYNRHKPKTHSKADYKFETTDDLIRFFASPYADSLCGKMNPRFIVKQLLEADIFIS